MSIAEPSLWRCLQSSLLAGEAVALATVVNQVGSAPQPEGASLLVRPDGSLLGAVSAGCLESDVVVHALQVLETGRTIAVGTPESIIRDPAVREAYLGDTLALDDENER